MANQYYTPSGNPATGASGSSSVMRTEFTAIQTAFGLLPSLSGNANGAVVVNAGGTALTVTGALSLGAALTTTGGHGTTFIEQALTSLTLPAASDTLVGRASTDTLTNKTLTAPILNGTITGTYTLGGTPTISGGTFTNVTLVNPALGTPASGVATNLTGTAASLTAGTVTTNANLTGPITSVGNTTSINSQTGTGSKIVVDTAPTLVTPALGAATATTVNGLTITSTTGTLTVSGSKALTISNTMTLAAGADGQTHTFPSTSSTLARTDAGQTFTGTNAFGTLTATTVNGLSISTSTGALSISNGKTLNVTGTLTFAGTDNTTMTFPGTNATIARTDAGNTFTGHQTIEGVTTTGATGTGNIVFASSPTLTTPTLGAALATTINGVTIPSATDTVALLGKTDQTVTGGANVNPATNGNLGTITTGTVTIDCGACPLQYLVNNGTFTIAAPSNDGSCILKITNAGSAGTISFSGFTANSNTGEALTTTNTSVFFVTVIRVGGVATYFIKALQ